MKRIRNTIIKEISKTGDEEVISPRLFIAKIELIILGEETNKETDVYTLAFEHLQLEVKKAWNSIKKSSQNNGTQQEMFNTQLDRIQARYSTKDQTGEVIIVPVMQMTEEQFDGKISEHRKSAKGDLEHANQLEMLRDSLY
jgi:hypothetical protein